MPLEGRLSPSSGLVLSVCTAFPLCHAFALRSPAMCKGCSNCLSGDLESAVLPRLKLPGCFPGARTALPFGRPSCNNNHNKTFPSQCPFFLSLKIFHILFDLHGNPVKCHPGTCHIPVCVCGGDEETNMEKSQYPARVINSD